MTDDLRHRILAAAAQVYAQHGWRGATTRRIADEAGVNEVTLFRHFGSKDALLDLMMREISERKNGVFLPAIPEHPEQELLAWATAHHRRMSGMRQIVRQMLSDSEERPDVAGCAAAGPHAAASQLRDYVEAMHQHGLLAGDMVPPPSEIAAAITMLMGAVFADGMNRDLLPAMFTTPVDLSLRGYVRIFLRGIGAVAVTRAPVSASSSTTEHA
jgi:AcrR family transcriptional regulator